MREEILIDKCNGFIGETITYKRLKELLTEILINQAKISIFGIDPFDSFLIDSIFDEVRTFSSSNKFEDELLIREVRTLIKQDGELYKAVLNFEIKTTLSDKFIYSKIEGIEVFDELLSLDLSLFKINYK